MNAAASLRKESRIFDALGCESGLKIFRLLSSGKKLCVSEIAKNIGLTLSATSHQLARLESVGLISSTREGRTVCYEYRDEAFGKQLCLCLKILKVANHKS